MTPRLIDCLGTTAETAELFSDASVLGAMLEFEAALARGQARLGLIPQEAAEAIARAAAQGLDAAAIAREARRSASAAIPMVKALEARVAAADPAAAGYVHWGSTSQDAADTALVLLLRRARGILEGDHDKLARRLRELSERHAADPMPARTLLQPAPPLTFGYKAAGWYGALRRCWKRLAAAFDEAGVLQLGGASGTLAAYGETGPALAAEVARELGLAAAPPWHAHRDRIASVVVNCGIYTSALGKMARDLALLMQAEVGEAEEPGGASSAMPAKRNPAGSALALAAAARAPGLAAAYLSGMVQEHERAAGGWQAEWQTVAGVVEAAASALDAMRGAAEGLEVHAGRMRENLERAGGAVFAAKALERLAARTGREAAREMLAAAARESRRSGRPLGEVLRERPEAARHFAAGELARLDDPADYLGACEVFRKQLLEE